MNPPQPKSRAGEAVTVLLMAILAVAIVTMVYCYASIP